MSSTARWALLRAWAERLPFDYETASKLSELLPGSIRTRAARDGWVVRNGHRGRSGVEELERLRERLWARLDAATDRPAGTALPKADVEAIHVLLKAVEKLEGACERIAAQESDPAAMVDLATLLSRINARIVDLARQMSGMQNGTERAAEEAEDGASGMRS